MLKTIHIQGQKKFFNKLISKPIGRFLAPGAGKFDGNEKFEKSASFMEKLLKFGMLKG